MGTKKKYKIAINPAKVVIEPCFSETGDDEVNGYIFTYEGRSVGTQAPLTAADVINAMRVLGERLERELESLLAIAEEVDATEEEQKP